MPRGVMVHEIPSSVWSSVWAEVWYNFSTAGKAKCIDNNIKHENDIRNIIITHWPLLSLLFVISPNQHLCIMLCFTVWQEPLSIFAVTNQEIAMLHYSWSEYLWMVLHSLKSSNTAWDLRNWAAMTNRLQIIDSTWCTVRTFCSGLFCSASMQT